MLSSFLSVIMSTDSFFLIPRHFSRIILIAFPILRVKLAVPEYPMLLSSFVDAVDIKLLPRGIKDDVHMIICRAVFLVAGAKGNVHHLRNLLIHYEVFAQSCLRIGVYREFPYVVEISLLHVYYLFWQASLFFGFLKKLPGLIFPAVEFFQYLFRGSEHLVIIPIALDHEWRFFCKSIALVYSYYHITDENALYVFRRHKRLSTGNVAHASCPYSGFLKVFPVELFPHVGIGALHPSSRAVFFYQSHFKVCYVLLLQLAFYEYLFASVHDVLYFLVAVPYVGPVNKIRLYEYVYWEGVCECDS